MLPIPIGQSILKCCVSTKVVWAPCGHHLDVVSNEVVINLMGTRDCHSFLGVPLVACVVVIHETYGHHDTEVIVEGRQGRHGPCYC